MSDYTPEKSGGSGLAVVSLLIGAAALAAAGAAVIMLTSQMAKANVAVEKAAASRIKNERQLTDMHSKLIAMEERLATADRNRQSLREQVFDLEEKLHSGTANSSNGEPGGEILELLGNGGNEDIGEAIGEVLMKSMVGLMAAGQAPVNAAQDGKPAPTKEDLVDEEGRPTLTPKAQRQPLAEGVPALD